MARHRLVFLDNIPSTQTYAQDMIKSGCAYDGMIITARTQSAGHGRYSRKWISNAGNLYVSYIYSITCPDSRLSYSVAVATAETLCDLGISPTIKWPNDILISGKKASGILIEYTSGFVIIGIGINIGSNPNIADYETTKLSDYVSTDVKTVLSLLTRNLDKWRHKEFKDVRGRWMELAHGLNTRVRYHDGIYDLIGIDERGALQLRSATESLEIFGDEIKFLSSDEKKS